MSKKAVNEFGFRRYLAINELRPKAEVDNTLRDVHNSFYYSFKIFP